MNNPHIACEPPYYLPAGVTPHDVPLGQSLYAVFEGREIGIHSDLARATRSVTGWPGQAWKGGAIDVLQTRWRAHCELYHDHTGNLPAALGAPIAAAPAALAAFPVPAAVTLPAVAVAPSAIDQPRVATPASPSLSQLSSLESLSQTQASTLDELDADAGELASQLRALALGDLRRHYFFVDGHVFHTRLSAELRVAQLFPNPRRRPAIQSNVSLPHILRQAFQPRPLGNLRFELAIWDLEQGFIDAIEECDVQYVIDLVNHLSLDHLSDLTAAFVKTKPAAGPML